ncbi:Phytosulfokines 3-like [Quillaja saponaria]|uniref:Phytosulfokine n=1 Tax=Quillaja saponaria TaxID=32244 RepID=A0AAD7PEK6_QUISA|nr:Phytosulfokines 3-like [Quillaja saponaria]
MAQKFAALFMAALLLCFTLSYAARPEPALPQHTVAKDRHGDIEAEMPVEMMNESCEGVGEEECLMRRTLAAHLDYIYTQKQNP